MAGALESLGLSKSDFETSSSGGGSALESLGLSADDFKAEGDGITGPMSALKNIGQGFNRGLGTIAGAADYAMLGFLDDTHEGRSKRPLGYVSNLLRGEEDIPLSDGSRFAREPTTTGERYLQAGGQALGESIGPAGVIAAPAKMAMRPATNAVEKGLQTLSRGQASKVALAGETAGAIGSGIGQEAGSDATPGSAVGPVVGGLVGGLAPSALAAPGARYAVGKARDAAATYLSPVASAKRARSKVVDEIGPHIETEATQDRLQQAAALRKEVEGFDPDLAQATGSEALKETKRDIVRRASGSELEAIRAREAGNVGAISDFARRNAPEGQGGADEALEPLVRDREAAAQQVRNLEEQRGLIPANQTEQLTGIRDKANQRLDQLTERERQLRPARDIVDTERQAMEDLTARTNGARADIAGQIRRVDRSLEGQKIRDSIKAERDRRKEKINALSKEMGIDELQFTTPFRNFARSVKQWQSDLLPSQAENMPAVMRDIKSLEGRPSVTFSDIKSLRESATDEVLEATRDTSPGHRKRLANAMRVRQMIDDQVLGPDVLEGSFADLGEQGAKVAHYVANPDFEKILTAAKRNSGNAAPGETLASFLVKRGGIQEQGGELFARDIKSRSRPGLYRKKGMTHEDAALSAWEAGYFPGQTTRPDPDMLRNALERDLAGQPQYREQDIGDIEDLSQFTDIAEDFTGSMDELGIPWHNASPDEIRARIQEMNEEPVDRSALADNYREFRRQYFEEIIEPFERGQVKKTSSKDGTGFYRTLDEEVALGFLQSADAAEQISRIAATQPELMASLEAVALDDLASSAVTNGVISPRSIERWAESRRSALQHLPSLRQSVSGIIASVDEVEQRFRQGKKIIRDRKLVEQNRLAKEKQGIARQRQDVRRVAASETNRIKEEARQSQARLKQAMEPLLQRMGAHTERRMAAEDTTLARRLAGIAKGTTTPVAVIDQAMEKPALMRKLWRATESHPDARKALQRHLWDGLTSLDGPALRQYLDDNQKSLKIAFRDSHIKKLRTISEALEMASFAPATGSAKPISTSLNDRIREATGLNVSAGAATAAAVSRGRSSKTVEGLRVLFQVLTERGRQGYERLMREALFNPEVAQSLVESAQFSGSRAKSTMLEDFATRRLRGWLWNLGISASLGDAGSESSP